MPNRYASRLATLVIPAIALACTFMPARPGFADISGSSATTSFSASSSIDYANLNVSELTSEYKEAVSKLAEKRAALATAQTKLAAGDTSVTSAQVASLQQEVEDLDALTTIIQELIVNANYAQGNSGLGSGGSFGGSGGSGSGNGGSTVADAIKQGALNGIIGSMMGNNGNTGNQVAGLAGFLQNPTAQGGAELLSGLTRENAGQRMTRQSAEKSAAAKAKKAKTCGGSSKSGSGSTVKPVGYASVDTAGSEPEPAKPAESGCEGAEYNTPNPTEKFTPPSSDEDDNTCSSKVASPEDAAQYTGQCVWGSNSSAGNQCECASLAKEVAGLDRASTWKQGNSASCSMPKGTAIATMGGGRYCPGGAAGGQHGCHAAVFLGCNGDGTANIMEQWNTSGGSHVRTWSAGKLAGYSIIDSGKQNGDGSRKDCETGFAPVPTLWDLFKLAVTSQGLPNKSNKLDS